MEEKSHTFMHGLKLWVIWNLLVFLSLSVVTVIGGFGWILISQGLGYVYLPDNLDFLLPLQLSLLIGCLLAGLVQWFAFRGRIKYSYLWIWATALGWFFAAISLFIYLFTSEDNLPPVDFYSIGWNILAGATAGAVIGLLQWLVLWRQVQGAGWWILGSVLGWASVGFVMYLGWQTDYSICFITPGLLPMGMITGVAYAYLFTQPSQKRLGEEGALRNS